MQKSQKTAVPSLSKTLQERQWRLIDAAGHAPGRLASKAAMLLQGKHKPSYVPFFPCGDFVIIVNSDKLSLKGKKWADKKYYSHSRYPGSLKERSAKDLGASEVLRRAIQGMLPKNKHRKPMMRRLKIFNGLEHGMEAQKPIAHKI